MCICFYIDSRNFETFGTSLTNGVAFFTTCADQVPSWQIAWAVFVLPMNLESKPVRISKVTSGLTSWVSSMIEMLIDNDIDKRKLPFFNNTTHFLSWDLVIDYAP